MSREKTARLPFHETIVGVIRSIVEDSSSDDGIEEELHRIASLIRATKIPANHLKIIAVWNWAVEQAGLDEESFGVMADLLEQWEEIQRAEKEKSEGKVEVATS